MSAARKFAVAVALALLARPEVSALNDGQSGWTLAEPPFYKTSFDCAKARAVSTEEAICKNKDLAKLDVEMAAAFRKRRESATGSEKIQVIQTQQEWLRVRNSYNVNPYHGDPAGARSDLEGFYKSRISSLESDDLGRLAVAIPEEREWLRAMAPEGFSKGFSIGRTYMGCEDPCMKAPSSYRWISIDGSGIGDEPGDIDTPFRVLSKRLASDGWTECRSADDPGKPTMNYFRKNDRMVAVLRYYSMGAGNSIRFGVTISGPLPENLPELTSPPVAITPEWATYSSPELGLKLRYPPKWTVRDEGPIKGVSFIANDFSGNFSIEARFGEAANHWPRGINDEGPEVSCAPSRYKISGTPAEQCVISGEIVGDGICGRAIEFEGIRTGRYALRFSPPGWPTAGASGTLRLGDLYEKILSTIQVE